MSTSSLADDSSGTSTATFTFKGWPSEAPPCTTPQSPPAKPLDTATAVKLCAPITGRNRNADCVFDVTITGEPGFVDVYLRSQQLIGDPIPVDPPTQGGTASLIEKKNP